MNNKEVQKNDRNYESIRASNKDKNGDYFNYARKLQCN